MMSGEPRDTDIPPVEVGSVGKTGFWLLIDDRELYVPFAWFPCFRNATTDALTTIERLGFGHLYWPKLDVDVAVPFIEYPTVSDRELPFSKTAHRVLALAGDEAQRLGHPYIGTEHLVLALTGQAQGAARAALDTLHVDGERVRASIEATVGPGTTATHSRRLSYTSTTKSALRLAKESAQTGGEREVSVEHLLAGVLRARGAGCAILSRHGLSESAVLGAIKQIASGGISGEQE